MTNLISCENNEDDVSESYFQDAIKEIFKYTSDQINEIDYDDVELSDDVFEYLASVAEKINIDDFFDCINEQAFWSSDGTLILILIDNDENHFIQIPKEHWNVNSDTVYH